MFKADSATKELLYSTDEGATWSRHQFIDEPVRVYGLITEPGENTTIFTMFGSRPGSHQWVIVTVDLKAAFGQYPPPVAVFLETLCRADLRLRPTTNLTLT